MKLCAWSCNLLHPLEIHFTFRSHYQYLGLEFELPMSKVLLNRGLARIQLGEKSESLVLVTVTKPDAPDDNELFVMVRPKPVFPHSSLTVTKQPKGLLFRPLDSKRKSLLGYPSTSIPFIPGPKSDSSSTYAPSQSDAGSLKKAISISSLDEKEDQFDIDTTAESSSSTSRHLRTDLIKVVGPDLMAPCGTEISTIPCAGVRIASGKLEGLMGWRLVVELDDDPDAEGKRAMSVWNLKRKQKGKFKEKNFSVVSNFILDTGRAKSLVSQEMLRALGYQGRYNRAFSG